MSAQAIGGSSDDLSAVAALQVLQQTQSGMAAVQAALSEDTGGGAAPVVSSSATAPGALEVFA
jgi:cell division GTPase FtsZ